MSAASSTNSIFLNLTSISAVTGLNPSEMAACIIASSRTEAIIPPWVMPLYPWQIFPGVNSEVTFPSEWLKDSLNPWGLFLPQTKQ